MGNISRMKHSTKFIIVLLTILIVGAAYVVFTTRGDTRIGLTLTTNPDLSRGLVGHWTFDGPDMDWGSTTSEVQDVSGQGNHGNATTTMSAATSPTSGVVGQGMQFDGVKDEILAGDDISTRLNRDFTLAAWVYFEDVSGYRAIISHDVGEWYFLKNNTSNKLAFAEATISVDAEANTALEANRWYHAVVTIGAGTPATVTFYLNGVPDGSDTTSGTYDDNATSKQVSIGSGGEGGGNAMKGKIDDVRIYDRALSAAEVKRLYDLGNTTRVAETVTSNPTLEDGLVGHWTFDGPDIDWSSTTAEVKDRSGQGNNGNATTTMSASKSRSIGVLGQGMNFDGVGDYVNIAENTYSDDMTISAWIKPNSLNFYETIVALAGSVSTERAGIHGIEDLYNESWRVGSRYRSIYINKFCIV